MTSLQEKLKDLEGGSFEWINPANPQGYRSLTRKGTTH